MNQNQLQQMFSQYGTVINARVLVENSSGQSKGVGFVLFDSKDEAETAMNSLNGSIPDGGSEALNIKFAEENAGKARPPAVMVVNSAPANAWGGGYATGGMGGYGGPMRNRGSNNQRYNPMAGNYGTPNSGLSVVEGGHILFVYNIGPDADERALWNLFAPFGTIQKVNVIRDHARGQGKGFGFVTMTNFHEAEQAILSLNGYRYYGKPLQVSFKS
jgi:RNA recognition motif-containing protein